MKSLQRFFSILVACMVFLSTTAFATPRASEQIYRYYLDAGSDADNHIIVDFSIGATGMMDRIGVESVVIYKRTTGWEFVDRYNSEDTDMYGTELSVSDEPSYANSLYFPSEANQEYQVTVTVFAEDYEGGSDSRSGTFTVET